MQSHRSKGIRSFTLSVLALVAIVAGGQASAAGWLAGASVGSAKQYDYSVGGEIADSDDSSVGYRAFGGFMWPLGIGVIGSYVDLGEVSYSGPAFGGFTDDLSASGFDLSLIGAVSPGQQTAFNIFGTIGLFRFNQDVHYVDPSGVFDYEDSGTSFSYALGLDYALGAGAKWGVHVEYQMFTDVGDEDNSGHEYDRSFISAGAEYRFGK